MDVEEAVDGFLSYFFGYRILVLTEHWENDVEALEEVRELEVAL